MIARRTEWICGIAMTRSAGACVRARVLGKASVKHEVSFWRIGICSALRDKESAKARPQARASGMREISFVFLLCVLWIVVFVCLRGLHWLKCRRIL